MGLRAALAQGQGTPEQRATWPPAIAALEHVGRELPEVLVTDPLDVLALSRIVVDARIQDVAARVLVVLYQLAEQRRAQRAATQPPPNGRVVAGAED